VLHAYVCTLHVPLGIVSMQMIYSAEIFMQTTQGLRLCALAMLRIKFKSKPPRRCWILHFIYLFVLQERERAAPECVLLIYFGLNAA